MSPRELSYDRRRLERLRRGAVLVVGEPAVFWVEGPGALPCLQGLLTNDLDKPGDHSLVYGALLTPKGAIVVDYWVFREPERFVLIAPVEGRLPSQDLFRRQLPPGSPGSQMRRARWRSRGWWVARRLPRWPARR